MKRNDRIERETFFGDVIFTRKKTTRKKEKKGGVLLGTLTFRTLFLRMIYEERDGRFYSNVRPPDEA